MAAITVTFRYTYQHFSTLRLGLSVQTTGRALKGAVMIKMDPPPKMDPPELILSVKAKKYGPPGTYFSEILGPPMKYLDPHRSKQVIKCPCPVKADKRCCSGSPYNHEG